MLIEGDDIFDDAGWDLKAMAALLGKIEHFDPQQRGMATVRGALRAIFLKLMTLQEKSRLRRDEPLFCRFKD